MTQPPLTHHDILGLLAPFTRQGRQVDLAASDRIARRLAFKPVPHDGADSGLPPLVETLQLELPQPGLCVLTRTLALAPDGSLRATLQARGADPGVLLAQIDAVPPRSQFSVGPGCVIACSHRLDGPTEAPQRVLTQAAATAEGLHLALNVPVVKGYPADIWIVAAAGDAIELPEDLLAVLGWNWSRLQKLGSRWSATLRLERREPARSRQAEAAWLQTVQHVARTLAEPPPRFHERLAGARWRVAVRRSVPLLAGLAMIGAALAVPQLALDQNSAFRMLVFNAPPLLLALGVSMKELQRFELPRVPRRSKAAAWRRTERT